MEIETIVIVAEEAVTRKPYVRPAVVLELELEARAGSPNNVVPGLDFLNPAGL